MGPPCREPEILSHQAISMFLVDCVAEVIYRKHGKHELAKKDNSDDKGAIACGAMTVRDKLVVGVSAVITMGNHVAQTHGKSRYTASLV